MNKVTHYQCESCEHIFEDKQYIEKCSECGVEICSACEYTSVNDGLSYCAQCAENNSDSIKLWEIVKGMSEGKFKVGMVFISDDNNEIFISDDDELLDVYYGTTVTILMNDKSKWRIKYE